MEKYTLYLDECTTKSFTTNIASFSMAGVIIKNKDYSIIENKLNILKWSVWANEPTPQNVISHQMEFNNAIRSRSDIQIVVISAV